MRRLYEKKDHLIRRNPNLTDGQKQEIIELLGKHPSYENKIDWNKSATEIHNFIRGLAPHPTAWTEVEHQGTKYTMKIYGARLVDKQPSQAAGTFVVAENKKHLYIAAKDGYIDILELQLSGKKRMAANVFLNGFHSPEDLKLL